MKKDFVVLYRLKTFKFNTLINYTYSVESSIWSCRFLFCSFCDQLKQLKIILIASIQLKLVASSNAVLCRMFARLRNTAMVKTWQYLNIVFTFRFILIIHALYIDYTKLSKFKQIIIVVVMLQIYTHERLHA